MNKFLKMNKKKIFILILILFPVVVLLVIPKNHFTFEKIEDCQSCHTQDGDLIFINTIKEAKYTGTESCKSCHEEVYNSHMKDTNRTFYEQNDFCQCN